MSKTNDGLGTFGKVITWLVVILLVVGVAGIAVYFIAREQGVDFSVGFGDKTYLANTEGGSVWLPPGETNEFTVRSLVGEDVNYDVKVLANPANDFTFEVGDELHSFCDDTDGRNDYTSLFGVVKSADGFTVSVPDVSVEQLVGQQYGGEIALQEALDPGLCYFVLNVSAGESEVSLWFNFTGVTVTLDPPSIAF